MRTLFVMLVLFLFVPASLFAVDDKEWAAIEADYDWLQTLRNSNPMPGKSANRKVKIEAWLANERKIEPVYGRFIDRLDSYYAESGDARAGTLYAAEKVRLADSYLEILSRYDRAINLYREALYIDPNNEHARTRLEVAENRLYISLDSLDNVEKGMTEADVEALVGLPREDWIRQKIEPGHVYTVWIYPRRDGGAAAVYFDGGVVYHTNWEAAPAPGPIEDNAAAQ